jgi:hypothetical protein
MNSGLIIAIAVVLFLYLVVRNRGRKLTPRTEASTVAKPSPEVVYQGLRNMVLHGTRERFGLPAAKTPMEPWGVVMDWGVPNGTATVAAMSDGSASIYLSGGGGFLGGGQKHESIRAAAKSAIDAAAELLPQMMLTADYSVPVLGEVTFYILTDAGVFTASDKEEELRKPGHALVALGNAMQNIITQYRILEDWKK